MATPTTLCFEAFRGSSWAPNEGILTDDLHLVRGVDFSGPIGDFAGIPAALLGAEVPQAQGPLLLTALAHLLLRQQPVVLQPLDFWTGVPAGHALESDRAADGTGDHPLPHFGWMGEARTNCGVTQIKRCPTLNWFIGVVLF